MTGCSETRTRCLSSIAVVQCGCSHCSSRSVPLFMCCEQVFSLLDAPACTDKYSRSMVRTGGSVAEWLACWTQAQKGLGSNHSRDAVGYNSLRQTVPTHHASAHQTAKLAAALSRVARVTASLAESKRQPTAWFMTHVTCMVTAKNRDQLRNPTLGNRVRAIFYVFIVVTGSELDASSQLQTASTFTANGQYSVRVLSVYCDSMSMLFVII